MNLKQILSQSIVNMGWIIVFLLVVSGLAAWGIASLIAEMLPES